MRTQNSDFSTQDANQENALHKIWKLFNKIPHAEIGALIQNQVDDIGALQKSYDQVLEKLLGLILSIYDAKLLHAANAKGQTAQTLITRDVKTVRDQWPELSPFLTTFRDLADQAAEVQVRPRR